MEEAAEEEGAENLRIGREVEMLPSAPLVIIFDLYTDVF